MAVGDVEVINTVAPKNDGAFPVARALEILGGYKSVVDATARDAIPASRREEGMMARTNDDGKLWTLGADLSTWTEFVGGGGGVVWSVPTYADLATIFPTPAYLQHVIVEDATGDPSGLTGSSMYSWNGAGWDPVSYFGGLSVIRTPVSAETQLSTINGDLLAAYGPTKMADLVAGEAGYAGFRYASNQQATPLPMDTAASGGIGSLVGGPFDSVSASIKHALTYGGKPRGARFLGTAQQLIYVNPSSGSDTTGDGLTPGTAYLTIQRAVDDVPNGFKCEVVIQVAAGTFGGALNVSVEVLPGWSATSGSTGRIVIKGDDSAPDITFATSQPFVTLVSGKRAQYTRNVGAYAATITDGSHWLLYTSSGVLTTRVAMASATPNLVVVQSASTTFPIGTKVLPYATTFTGTVFIQAPRAGSGNPFVHLMGIKFTATSGIISGVVWNGANFTTTGSITIQDSNFFAGYFQNTTGVFSLTDGDFGRRTMFSTFWNGHVSVRSARSSCQGCVYRGNNQGSQATLSLGSGTTGFQSQRSAPKAGFQLFTNNDFEIATGTLDHIWMFNGYLLGDTSGNNTFNGGGAAVKAEAHSLIVLKTSSNWTGSVGAPSLIYTGSIMENGSTPGFQVDNATTPGDDIRVGDGGPATDKSVAYEIVNVSDMAYVK